MHISQPWNTKLTYVSYRDTFMGLAGQTLVEFGETIDQKVYLNETELARFNARK